MQPSAIKLNQLLAKPEAAAAASAAGRKVSNAHTKTQKEKTNHPIKG